MIEITNRRYIAYAHAYGLSPADEALGGLAAGHSASHTAFSEWLHHQRAEFLQEFPELGIGDNSITPDSSDKFDAWVLNKFPEPKFQYAHVKPEPSFGEPEVHPADLKQMRDRAAQWPDCRWAAAQNNDLSSRDVGQLHFMAVGPGRGVCAVTSTTLIRWSCKFVGFVNLETGKLQSTCPET